MKQRMFLLLAFVFLIVLLVGLNAASYVQQEKTPDSEATPNRSTYNNGATGTRAFFDLLSETGSRVDRWREPITKSFEAFDGESLSTFVIVGQVRRRLVDEEIQFLLNWVWNGGRLVLIDRELNEEFLVTSSAWQITQEDVEGSISGSERPYLVFSVDPADQGQMIAKTEAVKPVLPSVYNDQVNAVQPSKFTTSITIYRIRSNESQVPGSTSDEAAVSDGDDDPMSEAPGPPAPEKSGEDTSVSNEEVPSAVPPANQFGDETGSGSGTVDGSEDENPDEAEELAPAELAKLAPVIHLSNDDIHLLADFPFGEGSIVVLSDPYVVSNGGIDLVDNAQAGLNIVGSHGGPIAFDEYHQGYGNNENRLLAYFEGTPVVSIFLQFAALVGIVIYSRGRRFARALPAPEKDRLSKLEYVAAMAQLQGRTKAFDLAVENVYTDFRRRVSRFFSVDNYTVSRKKLAELVSERIGADDRELYDLMCKCEDIMHGEPTGKREVVRLLGRLREVEEQLGLKRGRRR